MKMMTMMMMATMTLQKQQQLLLLMMVMMMVPMAKVMTKMMKTPVTMQRCGGAVNQHYDRKQGIAPLSF